ncbi:hypothetical protein K1W69_24655 [Hoeflea sp. WL0058]|uniref:Uncharacterized protein n=1 Tax=Flavimaribacter sediminis TaxID=2865987 RepID=A0AAE2ZQT6_9HYPH|nr:hypothetical protein [Flavimaribacter sediminis]MBW8640406.1 hypothetical protein [Flavimaribacter sediminis]
MTVSAALRASLQSPDAKRLARLRAQADALPSELAMAYSDGLLLIEWTDPATKKPEILASFLPSAPSDLVEQLAAAPETIRFLLNLIDRATTKIRDLQGRQQDQLRKLRPNGNYAANCAIVCDDPLFREYMELWHGLERDADRDWLVGKLHKVLEISSRRELNTNPAAAARWLDLLHAYNGWKADR